MLALPPSTGLNEILHFGNMRRWSDEPNKFLVTHYGEDGKFHYCFVVPTKQELESIEDTIREFEFDLWYPKKVV